MKLAVNIIFPIILFAKITFSQTILENKFTFDTIENIAVSKRLIGAWNLVKTIRYENLDTITKEPSVQLWENPDAKPPTKIVIDSLNRYEVDQYCMKCPYLFWKGVLGIEVRVINEKKVYYLNFIDDRLLIKRRKRKKHLVLEFSGILKKIANNELIVSDKEGRDWVYIRLQKD